jgi:tRNA pseudouridine55 synthase
MDLDGVVPVDKQPGRTSFETVQQVRKRLKAGKAGHAGTLDKSASGLLLVCVGRATAFQNLLMSMEKRYRGRISLGMQTDTLDRYGRIVSTGASRCPSGEELDEVLRRFTGRILQVPPLYSAVHHSGERLYRRALRGERPRVQPREVEIASLSLVDRFPGGVEIEAVVSKGTYIRALARDIARALGTCGYLGCLRRLAVGPFTVDGALRVEQVQGQEALVPLESVLEILPALEVGEREAELVSKGVPLHRFLEGPRPGTGYFRITNGGRTLAVVRAGEVPRYFKVLHAHR